MNLSTVLVMRDKLSEASGHLLRAWRLLQGKHDVTTLRVLFLQYVIAQLQSEPGNEFLGYLKALLKGEQLKVYSNIVVKWEIHYLLVYLRQKLSPEITQFLDALIKALNDPTALPILDKFNPWCCQEALPPWDLNQ